TSPGTRQRGAWALPARARAGARLARDRLPDLGNQIPPYAFSMTTADEVLDVARRARTAATQLAPMTRAAKDAALLAMADALVAESAAVLAANREDLDRGREGGLSEAILDRLALDEKRIGAMADGLRQVAALPDPVGEVLRGSTL